MHSIIRYKWNPYIIDCNVNKVSQYVSPSQIHFMNTKGSSNIKEITIEEREITYDLIIIGGSLCWEVEETTNQEGGRKGISN